MVLSLFDAALIAGAVLVNALLALLGLAAFAAVIVGAVAEER